ncbi:hypothetical protein MTQ13_00265 [Streptomyces sp. XM4011]|uniref:hypothetical protein n=1 Tax=Streptomyces sp. XM4011 TaxID=2929780 RepID=UPI001FFB0732|nr:hypothetical protein [Streptomyces sp. XM4011]MCK1812725.1 hypothetical protein [Streptomyces sp. XM4011]
MGQRHNATSPEAAARIARARAQANVITCFIAAIGTAASLIGMWPVTRAAVLAAGVPDDLVSPLALTALGLLEGTIIVCGLRARANVMETGRAGVDGMALWFAVSASATVSAAEAALAAPAGTPPGEQLVVVLVRLIAPITAGWLWERGLAPERRAANDSQPRVISTYMNRLRAHLISRAGQADTSELHRRRAAARAARLADQLTRADEQNLSLRQRWTLRRLRHAIRVSGAAHHVDQRNYLLNDIAATRHAFSGASTAMRRRRRRTSFLMDSTGTQRQPSSPAAGKPSLPRNSTSPAASSLRREGRPAPTLQ